MIELTLEDAQDVSGGIVVILLLTAGAVAAATMIKIEVASD